MNKIHIVLRPLTKVENEKLVFNLEVNDRVISVDESYLEFSKVELIEVPTQVKKDILDNCFAEVLNFPTSKLDGVEVKERFKFKEINYWYYFKFSVFNTYFPVEFDSQIIEYVLSESSFLVEDEFIIYSLNNLNREKSVCITPASKKKKSGVLNLIGFSVVFFFRFLIGFFQSIFIFNKTHVFLKWPFVKSKIINPDDITKKIYGNIIVEYATLEMNKNKKFAFVSDVFLPNKSGEKYKLNQVINRYTMKSFYLEFFLVISLFNPFFWLKFRKFYQKMKYAFLVKDKESKSNVIFKIFNSKKKMIYVLFWREESFKTLLFFKKKLKTLGTVSEYDFNNASLYRAALVKGLKVVAVQHGTVHDRHMHYVFTQNDKDSVLIPTSTIVWGDYWKEVLKKNSIYTDDNLEVLGQLRTDVIHKIQDKYPASSDFSILYVSSGIELGLDTRGMMIREVMKLCNLFPDIRFFVRPHPNEFDAEEYYSKIANEYGVTNYTLDTDDLYVSLNRHQVVMIYDSTVGGEAIYFDKTVIIMDYLDNDKSNYSVYSSIFHKGKNVNEIAALIAKIKNKELISDKEERAKFIKEYVYKIDGETTKRYVDFIEKS